jgi:hypothetical protein
MVQANVRNLMESPFIDVSSVRPPAWSKNKGDTRHCFVANGNPDVASGHPAADVQTPGPLLTGCAIFNVTRVGAIAMALRYIYAAAAGWPSVDTARAARLAS